MPTFNKQHLADLTKQEADAKKALQDCTASLNDTFESDGWDDAKRQKYQDDNLRHAQLTRDYKTAKEDREAYAMFEPERAKKSMKSAFARYLAKGLNGLEAWEQESMTTSDLNDGTEGMGKPFVIKGATASDNSSGVEVTDIETRRNVIDTLKAYGGAAQMAYQFSTANGNQIRLPAHDDVANEGVVLPRQGENTTEVGLNDFQSINYGARTIHSGRIRITREMIQDAIIDIESFAEARAVRRIGRGWDKRFTLITTGANKTLLSTEPGAGNAPGDGEVSLERAASNGPDAPKGVTYDNLINLIYSVPAAYREGSEFGERGLSAEGGGRTGFILSEAGEKAVRLLKDEDGRPLWQPANASINTMGGGMILGYPYAKSYVLDGNLATNSTKDVWFGNFSYFGIRTVNTFEVFRFMDSRTMENNEVEIIAFSRRFARHMANIPGAEAGKSWPGLDIIKKMVIKA